jgi:hypothetical protein
MLLLHRDRYSTRCEIAERHTMTQTDVFFAEIIVLQLLQCTLLDALHCSEISNRTVP